jgi:beta-galactosidase
MPYSAPAPVVVAVEQAPALEMMESDGEAIIVGPEFRLTFDKRAGRISAFSYRDTALLASGPVLNIWRAATDNDGFKLWPEKEDKLLFAWLKAGLDRLELRTETGSIEQPAPHAVRLSLHTVAQAAGVSEGFEHYQTYTIYGSGDVIIENRVEADPKLPPLPRIGLTMALPAGFEQFSWYGRGPHESYIDRKAGVAVGLYRGTVDEQYVPYIMPQENGNKTDVRWLTLSNEQGIGLLAVGQPWLEASASHYKAHDLYKALHTIDLVRRPETILNLDLMQCGLGGASCGPGTLPQYLIQPGSYSFTVRLRPFVNGQDDPARLSREQFQL